MADQPKTSYIYAVGRRKEATAEIRLLPGKGEIVVNGRTFATFFSRADHRMMVMSPFEQTGTTEQFDVQVTVSGGGVTGQAESVRMAISRALQEHNPDFRASLKKSGFLTRDSRIRERKKYGKLSARRSPQWSKR